MAIRARVRACVLGIYSIGVGTTTGAEKGKIAKPTRGAPTKGMQTSADALLESTPTGLGEFLRSDTRQSTASQEIAREWRLEGEE